jgi:two-component system OmpR family response regulator
MQLLLAEDDPILANGLTAQLHAAGFTVEHAPNGPVAEFLLTRQTFDIAIIDLGLPMVDGLTVLKNLRATRPDLPVLVLTALDRLDSRVAGLTAGADDYMTKPFVFP